MTLSLVEEVVVRLQRGEDPEAFAKELAAFLKKPPRRRKKPSPPATDDGYSAIFAKAIADCGCDWTSPELTSKEFMPEVFGTLGEGYVLTQPPKTAEAKKRGRWNMTEIDAWLASADVAGKDLEPAYLVDLAQYGKDNPGEQLIHPVVSWRPTKNDRVAFLLGDGSERGFGVIVREDHWVFDYWFLLRRMSFATRFKAAIAACGCDWNSPVLTPEEFTPELFGTLGERYVLGQPPKTTEVEKRGWWNETEIDVWHASAVSGKDLEPAYLVDLAKYGEKNPDEQRKGPIVCWRATRNGHVAYLDRNGRERYLLVCRRNDDGRWPDSCRFLLRKVLKAA